MPDRYDALGDEKSLRLSQLIRDNLKVGKW